MRVEDSKPTRHLAKNHDANSFLPIAGLPSLDMSTGNHSKACIEFLDLVDGTSEGLAFKRSRREAYINNSICRACHYLA